MFSTDGSSIDDQIAGSWRAAGSGSPSRAPAGLLAARLTEVPGSSEYVAGGVVAYSNQAKVELLDVPEQLIERHGAVSPEIAEAMAEGALARFHGDLGVGITGVAGPRGGTEAKPIGYVCICVKSGGRGRDRARPGPPGQSRRDP